MNLDHDMKNNRFGFSSIKPSTLKQSDSFQNWQKSVKNRMLKIINGKHEN